MSDIIEFKKASREVRIKKNLGKFPQNIIKDLMFKETFGIDIDADNLPSTAIEGLFAWIAATYHLAYWGNISPIPSQILFQYYVEGQPLAKISKECGQDICFSDVLNWLYMMKACAIKYGFHLWVIKGTDKDITGDDLIEVHSNYAKACWESKNGKYPGKLSIKELYPIYCIDLIENPFTDIQKYTNDDLNDFVCYCAFREHERAEEFSDILKAKNWTRKTALKEKYIFADPDDKEQLTRIVTNKKNVENEW